MIDRCAYVVQLDEGLVSAQGTPEELRSLGLLAALKETEAKEEAAEAEEPVTIESTTAKTTSTSSTPDKPARKLVDKEGKAQYVVFPSHLPDVLSLFRRGRVNTKIYHVYLKASSYILTGLAVFLILLNYSSESSKVRAHLGPIR